MKRFYNCKLPSLFYELTGTAETHKLNPRQQYVFRVIRPKHFYIWHCSYSLSPHSIKLIDLKPGNGSSFFPRKLKGKMNSTKSNMGTGHHVTRSHLLQTRRLSGPRGQSFQYNRKEFITKSVGIFLIANCLHPYSTVCLETKHVLIPQESVKANLQKCPDQRPLDKATKQSKALYYIWIMINAESWSVTIN